MRNWLGLHNDLQLFDEGASPRLLRRVRSQTMTHSASQRAQILFELARRTPRRGNVDREIFTKPSLGNTRRGDALRRCSECWLG